MQRLKWCLDIGNGVVSYSNRHPLHCRLNNVEKKDALLRMRNKDPGNILETIDRRLVSFGQKYQHSSQSPFLQFELH